MRILALGPHEGWHADRLRAAANHLGISLDWAKYETLAADFDGAGVQRVTACMPDDGPQVRVSDYDHVLTRTMPVGSLEQITLRLGVLHTLRELGHSVVNGPSGLEIAIDKYRTLARVAALGIPVPATRVVQTRRAAMEAFTELGGDIVVKPLFGGEGRGVLRVMDRELAWFTFATLDRIDAVLYLQPFVRPGGIDTRVLVLGETVFGLRRQATEGWKTNVSHGGRTEAIEVPGPLKEASLRIAADLGLRIAAVDWIECETGPPRVLEVNAIPGWKGAEAALGVPIAEYILRAVMQTETRCPRSGEPCPIL